jgi:hypothetical protein
MCIAEGDYNPTAIAYSTYTCAQAAHFVLNEASRTQWSDVSCADFAASARVATNLAGIRTNMFATLASIGASCCGSQAKTRSVNAKVAKDECEASFKAGFEPVFVKDETAGGLGDPSNTKMSFGVAFADVDGDGDVDALVVNRGQANELYVNQGSGIFVKDETAGGLGDPSNTKESYNVAFADVDGDGDVDALVVNQNQAQANELYVNQAPVHVESGEHYAAVGEPPVCEVDVSGRTHVYYSMAQHPSFKCTHTGSTCACTLQHPTHHKGGCKQFESKALGKILYHAGDCTASGQDP